MTKIQECLAQNIKKYRKLRDMTQEQLAEKAGTATNYIGTIETGRKFPSPGMIERIAAALQIDELLLFSPDRDDSQQTSMLRQRLMRNIERAVEETLSGSLCGLDSENIQL